MLSLVLVQVLGYKSHNLCEHSIVNGDIHQTPHLHRNAVMTFGRVLRLVSILVHSLVGFAALLLGEYIMELCGFTP